jgi:hypothetical protein
MTAYNRYHAIDHRPSSAQEAKAGRQAVLDRVRKQRAVAYKRTVQQWIQVGAIIRASELKKQYHSGK